jgi:hypothetical protein
LWRFVPPPSFNFESYPWDKPYNSDYLFWQSENSNVNVSRNNSPEWWARCESSLPDRTYRSQRSPFAWTRPHRQRINFYLSHQCAIVCSLWKPILGNFRTIECRSERHFPRIEGQHGHFASWNPVCLYFHR